MKRLFCFSTACQSRNLEGKNQLRRYSLVRMMLMAITMMMLAPSAMNGATTTINFETAALGAYFHAQDPTNAKYNVEYVMGESYSAINGAKVGNVINYKYSNTGSVDISRLAFVLNTSGAGNAANEGAGFYLRRDATNKVAGLYVGNWEQKLAVLGLRPGDKVTFKYSGTDISENNANIHVENENSQRWFTQLSKGQTATETVDINFIGDLIIKPNKGTIINSITVYPFLFTITTI